MSKKNVSFNPLTAIKLAQPYLHEKQTKQERMQSLKEVRKNGMDEPASPRTIYNTWQNDNGAYGGRKKTRKRTKRTKKRTKRRTKR